MVEKVQSDTNTKNYRECVHKNWEQIQERPGTSDRLVYCSLKLHRNENRSRWKGGCQEVIHKENEWLLKLSSWESFPRTVLFFTETWNLLDLFVQLGVYSCKHSYYHWDHFGLHLPHMSVVLFPVLLFITLYLLLLSPSYWSCCLLGLLRLLLLVKHHCVWNITTENYTVLLYNKVLHNK